MGYRESCGALYEGHSSQPSLWILQLCCIVTEEVWYNVADSGMTEYKAINILDDQIIREQVKIYSKWPTYPQLYIDGELIGGSNILH